MGLIWDNFAGGLIIKSPSEAHACGGIGRHIVILSK